MNQFQLKNFLEVSCKLRGMLGTFYLSSSKQSGRQSDETIKHPRLPGHLPFFCLPYNFKLVESLVMYPKFLDFSG